MVVLNFYGKIQRTCISEKLGLYLSNLPDEEDNNWRKELAEEIELAVNADGIYQEKIGTSYTSRIGLLYSNVYPERTVPGSFEKEHYYDLAGQMICLSFEYDYNEMPLGGWDTNCFDGRLCEEDCAEKVVDLINFLAHDNCFPEPIPQWVYSSNHDGIDHYRIFWGGESSEAYIESLREWGKLFDSFLQSKNDYLLFDYILNAVHKDNEYNEYHLMKAYSLCQLFLEKEHERELDQKMIQFIDDGLNEEEKGLCASYLRKLRNKIAHGDFEAFENIIEEYAVRFMDDRYDFDYSEYSRKNWVMLHVCCLLDDVVRNLIRMTLYEKASLESIKNAK